MSYSQRYREAFVGQIRAIESLHQPIHEKMLEWGRWSRGKYFGQPKLAVPSIWTMPGDYDPDLDPDAVPESKPPPLDIKSVNFLTDTINREDFCLGWKRIVVAHYVSTAAFHEKPIRAKCGAQHYLDQLGSILQYLGNCLARPLKKVV